MMSHSGRAQRDPEPRGKRRGGGPWVPGSRFASPGMTLMFYPRLSSQVQQMRIAALGGDVDADGAFFGEAGEIIGAAGLGAGAGEARAAERLHADDGADNG